MIEQPPTEQLPVRVPSWASEPTSLLQTVQAEQAEWRRSAWNGPTRLLVSIIAHLRSGDRDSR
ncbi:hypothetical protein CS0771_13860 [Catellatospora sp. IY07-71]|nr:hypothetical protein CS0771_13860 [Catellatospora sp. IY07-71]